MEHLFSHWAAFQNVAMKADHILLLFDYDGTLTPIVARPEQALLPASVEEKLRTLVSSPEFSVGIVSGRSLAESKELVGIEGIYYAGNHGLEIQGPGIDFISPQAELAMAKLGKLAFTLENGLRNIPGIIVQDKGLSLSVHYRRVRPELEERVAGVVRKIVGPLVDSGTVKLFTGKKVWEVRPPIDWDKGRAVETIRDEITKRLNLEKIVTVFIGDDLTDEDGFKVLHKPGGWGIYVGGDNPNSKAACYLESTAEVEEFLKRIFEIRA